MGRADGADRRVVTEPQAGLSHARNRALAASTSDVVLFTDDDALVTPGWARAHLAAYEDPARGVVGRAGRAGVARRTAGVDDRRADAVVRRARSRRRPGPYPTAHGPYGVNMAVRRLAAIAVGGYEPSLGRVGRRLLSGEEPDLHRRLAAAGHVAVYVPAAGLVHHVTAERADRRWLLRRGWAQGVTNARLEVLAAPLRRRAAAQRAAAELVDAGRRWSRRRSGADGEEELAALARVAAHAAHGVEMLRMSVGRGPVAP